MKPAKITSLSLAVLCAGNMLLCSCDSTPVPSDTTAVPTTVTSETTATTTEETTEQAWVTYANAKDSSPYKEIELDGVKENYVVTTDYCYLESEKYIVFMDKDLKIPGDFAVNLDAIIEELEKQLGLEACPESYGGGRVVNMTSYYEPDESGKKINPWEDWDIGNKIAIFLVVDREDKALLSVAEETHVVICTYSLFSDELWNSIPTYKNNAWRRDKYVNYSMIAHELTHTITLRSCCLTNILTEGIAEYMGWSVLKSLSKQYPSIGEAYKKTNFDDSPLPKVVNAKNAESIFIDDYHSLSHKDRGAEYYYGKRLWQYIYAKNGSDCFIKYVNAINEKNLRYNYIEYNKNFTTQYADTLKELFGKDVFTGFGNWCVKNKYLQSRST